MCHVVIWADGSQGMRRSIIWVGVETAEKYHYIILVSAATWPRQISWHYLGRRNSWKQYYSIIWVGETAEKSIVALFRSAEQPRPAEEAN